MKPILYDSDKTIKSTVFYSQWWDSDSTSRRYIIRKIVSLLSHEPILYGCICFCYFLWPLAMKLMIKFNATDFSQTISIPEADQNIWMYQWQNRKFYFLENIITIYYSGTEEWMIYIRNSISEWLIDTILNDMLYVHEAMTPGFCVYKMFSNRNRVNPSYLYSIYWKKKWSFS